MKAKALNRITDHVCKAFGWEGEEKVTPHGFRATISTILAEKGADMTAIKFLLGHRQQDNLTYYVRKHSRLLNLLRRQINQMEEALMQAPSMKIIKEAGEEEEKVSPKQSGERPQEMPESELSKETLVKLIETDPKLASMLIEKKLIHL
ncbi:site-specific integrase [Salicibibacter cibi]|uniref:Site-specific integrase n=1 Tax=Salicibibacter cibi TaxID=2743001 RepID=A0A7T6ZB79_9BACI|nr:tyrosine-type recombinase/integrase [Salicibibacter cibi]QQK80065.1 site-specific integrase [Salicibibacter cibi]